MRSDNLFSYIFIKIYKAGVRKTIMAIEKIEKSALSKLGCTLYVAITKDGNKDNGCITNSVMQVAGSPLTIAVSLNKNNLTHDMAKKSGVLNICSLDAQAPFSVFQNFGFRSGRDADKFGECQPPRSSNGVIYLPHYSNAFLSLKVVSYVDVGSHGLFICHVDEAKTLSDVPSMMYDLYKTCVKPQSLPTQKVAYVCEICGYVYDGDTLPDDFVCPICKHGASDFKKVIS